MGRILTSYEVINYGEIVKSPKTVDIVTSRHGFVSGGPVISTTSGFPDKLLVGK
jgi:hypothetical protein